MRINIKQVKRIQKRDGKKEVRKKLTKLEGNEVNSEAKQSFIHDFGNLPVSKWERLDYYDEATFTKKGEVLSAFYDGHAKLVGTTVAKLFTDIPAIAQNYITEKYKKYSIDSVLFYDDNELNDTNLVLFGLQFDNANSYFVVLKKKQKKIVVQVDNYGNVSYYNKLK